jgi:acetyl-CoA carboxylase carboxyl transferase subunit beta
MAWYKREDSDDVFSEEKRSVPAGVFTKCPGCRAALLTADLEKNDGVCPQCDHHFPVQAARRMELVLDPGTFTEADASIESVDPLGFKDSKRYADRLRTARRNAGGADAVLVGTGKIEGLPVEDGRQFVAADGPADMAASILSLLERNDERSRLSAAARRFVEESVSTASAAKVFEQICQHALRGACTQ